MTSVAIHSRVNRAHVEDVGSRAVRELAGVPRDLERDDLPALDRAAEDHELDEVRVALRESVQLVADPSGLVVRAIDLVAGGGHGLGLLADRLAVPVSDRLHVDALPAEPVGLTCGEHELELHATRDPLGPVSEVVALAGELRCRPRVDGRAVHVQRLRTAGAERRAETASEAPRAAATTVSRVGRLGIPHPL